MEQLNIFTGKSAQSGGKAEAAEAVKEATKEYVAPSAAMSIAPNNGANAGVVIVGVLLFAVVVALVLISRFGLRLAAKYTVTTIGIVLCMASFLVKDGKSLLGFGAIVITVGQWL
jgi:hypothetical protein